VILDITDQYEDLLNEIVCIVADNIRKHDSIYFEGLHFQVIERALLYCQYDEIEIKTTPWREKDVLFSATFRNWNNGNIIKVSHFALSDETIIMKHKENDNNSGGNEKDNNGI
jgi:hypothetical protein